MIRVDQEIEGPIYASVHHRLLSLSAEADRRGALGTEYPPQEEVAEGEGPKEGPVARLPQEQLQHQ